MSSDMTQLIILAVIALFVFMRLFSVLGTRDGFEAPKRPADVQGTEPKRDFEVIVGDLDQDIADHVDPKSPVGQAITKMKRAEPGFNLNEFLSGARQAYEMILMAFENGDRDTLRQFLSDEVYESFDAVITDREEQGLRVEAEFGGVREIKLADASYSTRTKTGEITIQYLGEITSAVKDAKGRIVEGDVTQSKRQKDVWTFAREMGSEDPNWVLVETGG